MFGNGLSDFDIKSLFDTTTRLGQIVELLIYAVIALVVTTVILLIYGKFVKNRLKAKNNLTIRLLIAPLIRFKTMAARINLRMIEIGFAVSLSDDSASRTQIDKIIGKI